MLLDFYFFFLKYPCPAFFFFFFLMSHSDLSKWSYHERFLQDFCLSYVNCKFRQLENAGALGWSSAHCVLPTQSLLVKFCGAGGRSSNWQPWFPAHSGGAGRQAGSSSRIPVFLSHAGILKAYRGGQNEALRALSYLYRETVRKINTA